MTNECKKAKKFPFSHFDIVFCTIQEEPVKDTGCYLTIVSAALTAVHLSDVASLWTLETESTDFILKKRKRNVMIGTNNTFNV